MQKWLKPAVSQRRRGAAAERTLMLRTTGVALILGVGALVGPTNAQAEVSDPRPNVVIVMADDMRADELAKMPLTRSLLGQFEVADFISNHPLCCPARAQLLTGQNAERSGVFHNGGPLGAYHSLREKDHTLARWFDDAGYRTGFVGKFLNGWWAPPRGKATVPAGWDRFNVWQGKVYDPDDYMDWNHGTPRTFGDLHTNDGVTQVVREQVADFSGGQPFLIYASYVAPHGMKGDNGKYLLDGPRPADRHLTTRVGAPDYMDKPSFTYTGDKKRYYGRLWRNRVRSLLSIDEGVRDIVADLKARGEWDNTVMVFMSDNGFMLGEHGAHGKNLPWEETLRTPFLATGPGVATGTSSKAAMTIDIPVSLAALAGITPNRGTTGDVEGRADLFSLGGGWGNRSLIQAGHDNHTNSFRWRGMRTSRWTYVHWLGGRQELYDRIKDPYQLRNLAGKRPAVQTELAAATPDPY